MSFNNLDNIPSDFIFDIASIPGSSDEVCRKTLEHYIAQREKPNLDPQLAEIATGIINALIEYYKLASFDSENLRDVLPHLSETSRFMEAQTSVDIDVESSGRIKSFYSEYVKILENITECTQKNIPIPEHDFLLDTWATRDILHPRHDMRYNPKAFYKLTYGLMLDFMEHIEELHAIDPRYSIREFDEETLQKIEKPKKYNFPPNSEVTIPEHSFIEYALEKKGLEYGYQYLPELSENCSARALKTQILALQKYADFDTLRKSSPLMKTITNQAKYDQLVNHRNKFELELLEAVKKEVATDYEALPFDEFFELNQRKLSALARDKFKYLNFLNEKISSHDNILSDGIPNFETSAFREDLKTKFIELAAEQEELIEKRIESVKAIKLDEHFEEKCLETQKLKRFSRSLKDYMRYPKQTGYQSFHVIVNTPYGPYEKQIRTEAQDDFAERGPASHTLTYKPDVKSTFHRLKVSTPFSPKRDSNGDIIIPTELGILPFELAVYHYYKQPFANFSGGKTLAEFKAEHPDKEDFDRAILALSPPTVSQKLLSKLWNKLFSKKPPKTPTILTANPAITGSIYSDVPEDISAYPNMPDAPKPRHSYVSTAKAPTIVPSEKDKNHPSDPHGDDGNR